MKTRNEKQVDDYEHSDSKERFADMKQFDNNEQTEEEGKIADMKQDADMKQPVDNDQSVDNKQSVDKECCERITEREQKLQASLITRLNRIEGQVRGVKGMIERNAYCDDVIAQVSAAQAALDSVSKMILENHIRCCLVNKIRNGEDEIVDELIVTIGKLL